MDKLDRLPVIKRSEVKTSHRCPACGTHLRRLGHFNPKLKGREANRIIEYGYACPNHKCNRKVLRKIDRSGIAAFEIHDKADPLAIKRAEALMEVYRIKTAEPVIIKKIEVEKLINPEPGGGEEV